jgi:hypothetical protein
LRSSPARRLHSMAAMPRSCCCTVLRLRSNTATRFPRRNGANSQASLPGSPVATMAGASRRPRDRSRAQRQLGSASPALCCGRSAAADGVCVEACLAGDRVAGRYGMPWSELRAIQQHEKQLRVNVATALWPSLRRSFNLAYPQPTKTSQRGAEPANVFEDRQAPGNGGSSGSTMMAAANWRFSPATKSRTRDEKVGGGLKDPRSIQTGPSAIHRSAQPSHGRRSSQKGQLTIR